MSSSIEFLHALTGHTDRTWSTSLHPTLPLIATASADKTVRIYDSRPPFAFQSLVEGNHKRSIRCAVWKTGEDAPILATASFDGTVGLWDFADDEWECAGLLEGHENEVKCVSFSASGTLLATCSRDKSIWIWDVENYEDPECLSVMQEHTQDVKCVRFHPVDALLASGSYDDTIKIWRDDGDDWICCATLEGHDGTVWCVDFEKPQTPTEEKSKSLRLVSASGDSSLKVWSRVDREKIKTVENAMPSIIRPSSNQTWKCDCTLPKSHQGDVYACAWSVLSGRIASAGEDGKITLYSETRDEEKAWVIESEKDNAHGVFEINHLTWGSKWITDDRGEYEILYSAGDDGCTNLWRVYKTRH